MDWKEFHAVFDEDGFRKELEPVFQKYGLGLDFACTCHISPQGAYFRLLPKTTDDKYIENVSDIPPGLVNELRGRFKEVEYYQMDNEAVLEVTM